MLLYHSGKGPGPALFFFVNGNFLIHACPVEDGEDSRHFVNYPLSHMDVWNQFYEQKYHVDFDFYPRGRIVYRKKDDTWLLYYDRCIGSDIAELIDSLPTGKVIAGFDEHYQCHRCNAFYAM